MSQEHRGHVFRLLTDVAPKLRKHLTDLAGPIGAWPEILPEPNLHGPPLSPTASNPFPPTGRTAEVELQALMTAIQMALSQVSSNAADALSAADEAHRAIVAASAARRDALKAAVNQYRETKCAALQMELQVLCCTSDEPLLSKVCHLPLPMPPLAPNPCLHRERKMPTLVSSL
jgi:hypothetical protein